jgi:hypothetical protein
LRASEEAAQRAGFRRLELISTLTGVPLYAAAAGTRTSAWRSHSPTSLFLLNQNIDPTA